MINILEYLREFKRNYNKIAVITLSFILIASIYTTFFIKQEYEATVKVFIGKQNFKNTLEYYNNEEVALYQRLISTYSEIIKSKKLINKSINESKINSLKNKEEIITYGSAINGLTVNAITDTQIIEIKHKSYDMQQSYDLLYSVTENLIAYSKELYPTVNIKVVEQVNVKTIEIASKKLMIAIITTILGIALSLGGIVIIMHLDNTFKDKNSLEREVEIAVLGVIPDLIIEN